MIPTLSICELEHCRISRNGTADIALGHRGRHWPRCFFIATGLSVALPHVGLAHVDPDRVARDPVHDGFGGSVEKVGVAPEPKRVGPASMNLEYG